MQWLEITSEQAGQRIDNFLLTYLKGVPRTLIYRVLRKGEVRVNKGRAKPTYRLAAGDVIRVPPLRLPSPKERAEPGKRVVERIEESVIYEDKHLLVLNKPAGLAVHGGSGVNYGVIEALRAARPEAPFLELVHRLDRDTSGCLMVAKRRSTLRAVHEMLRSEGVDKRYLALVQGTWPERRRSVSASLRKNTLSSGERMVRVSDDGKASTTEFRLRARLRGATLIEAAPLTGRTHQIRVHAAHAGHPIAGDEKYGEAAFNRAMRERGLTRLFLHAESLSLRLPASGERLRVSAPLDDDLQKIVEGLRLDIKKQND